MAVMRAGGSYGCSLNIIDLCYPGTHPYLLGHIRGLGSKLGKPLRGGDSCTASSRRVCSLPSCELRPASRTPHPRGHLLHCLPSPRADLQRDNGRSSGLRYAGVVVKTTLSVSTGQTSLPNGESICAPSEHDASLGVFKFENGGNVEKRVQR